MDVKKIVLLVGALLIAGVTAVMAKNMFSGASAPQAQAAPAQPAPQGPEVLVAARTLPVGTIIDAEAFKFQPWPQGLVQDAYFTRGENGFDPQSLIGTVVRNEISAGQPLSSGAIVRPGELGFLPRRSARHARVTVRFPPQRRRGFSSRAPGRPVRLRRSRAAATGRPCRLRDDHPQHPRARRRSRSPLREAAIRCPAAATVTFESTPTIAEKRGRADHRNLRCRCGRSPTTMPSSSAPSPRARSGCPAMPTRAPSGSSCCRSRAGRSIPTRLIRWEPTSPASSAGACPEGRARAIMPRPLEAPRLPRMPLLPASPSP